MLDIKFLQTTWFFKTLSKKWGDLLYDEWDSDNNFYIILSWSISIEKYTSVERYTTKQLATLWKSDFFWEGSLSSYAPKEVLVKIVTDTELLYIEWKKDFSQFLEKYPEQAKDILTYIISITNRRVSESNKYITSIYEVNRKIKELKNVNYKSIFIILDTINSLLWGEFLLFLEVNPVMKEYLTLKYDSRENGKMKDVIVKKWEYNLEDIWVIDPYKIITKEISIWNDVLGSIIVWRNNLFNESEKRIFLWMVTSLSWVLKQKNILEEERDKNFADQ